MVDSPWPGGGAQGFFVGFWGGGEAFFGAVREGQTFFFARRTSFLISDDHVINATSLIELLSHLNSGWPHYIIFYFPNIDF